MCLGTQLLSIINVVKDLLPRHMWYQADVEAVGNDGIALDIHGHHLTLIGSDFLFSRFCSEIESFYSGVFLCIDAKFSSQDIQNIELEATDDSFRPINLDGVLLEIIAFDASCFEIFSEDKKLIDALLSHFQSSDLLLVEDYENDIFLEDLKNSEQKKANIYARAINFCVASLLRLFKKPAPSEIDRTQNITGK